MLPVCGAWLDGREEVAMRRKAVKFAFLFFAFLVLTAFASVSEAKTIYVPDDYARIQWAIDNASAGDTIIVRDGIYYESITVSKQLTIKSENGSDNCIINGGGSLWADVFTLKADGIRIKGFTITGGWNGILISSNNNSISNNIISNNHYGIWLDYSNNNSISKNNISSNNNDGIALLHSNKNSILNNIISSNNRYGIRLYDSNSNTIKNNEFIDDGLFVDDSYRNFVEDNTVNEKPLVYLEDESDEFIHNAGQIILVRCTNIIVMNAEITNTDVGIELLKSDNCLISNSNISNNYDGIFLYDSNKNSISNNIISSNNYGIDLRYSDNNSISENNISSNNWEGIYLSNSNENSISENIISSNNDEGIDLWHSSNNSISSNIISNNKYGIFFYDSNKNSISNNIISDNDNGIYLEDSNNNSISEDNISNNDDGIHLYESTNNSILENNISDNDDGIGLWYSNENSILRNNISSNNNGIVLGYSNNNIIYLNNFINNTYNAFSYGNNIWNSTEPITYTYKGSTFTNYMGNYWDDYKGSDANGDGIGDTPYSIDSDKDYYPLMRPFEYYFAPDEQPIVSISTDKYEYRAGDVMLINITFENPKDEGKSVKFLWRLDIHDYNLSFKVINNKSLLLPPEFKRTFVISWRLPKLSVSFNASWYVALYDGVISEDTADWRYIGAKKKGKREIAREMAELREIERSVLQSAKLIKSEE